MMPPFRPSLLALATAGSLGLAACGGSSVDTGEIEQMVVAQFKEQGVDLTDTRCEEVEAEVGAAVRCTALNPERTKLFIEGEVTAIEDDTARFSVVAARGEAHGPAVAADARKLLEAEVGHKAEAMTCPKTVAIPTATPARCTLTVGGGTRYGVAVTIDKDGKVGAVVDDQPIS